MNKNYNMSAGLIKAYERAIYISEDLKINEICTASLGLAILMDESFIIQKSYLEETGYIIDTRNIIFQTINDQTQYKNFFGVDYPEDEISDIESGTDDQVFDSSKNEAEQQTGYDIIIISPSQYEDNGLFYDNIKCSDNLQKAFEDAYKRCNSNGQSYIDAENLMYSILKVENTSFSRIIQKYQLNTSELIDILNKNAQIYEVNEGDLIKIPASLETCCEVMNNNYSKGDVCPILGREKEIQKVWNIFSKKTKRNVVLVGEPGVGKTAIAEAITMQIVNGKCPKDFRNYTVISLNLTSMVAGTKYRGEFETKVQNFIKLLKNNNRIIVFIDEIHQIFGTGSAEGSGPDLSGSLKPLLARDDVIFIGSTTTLEYEEYFSQDPAFKRRFEIIDVKEPRLACVKKMVELKVRSLSEYHKVSISDEILDYIIITAKAMNYNGKNPDITIDLVDKSMANAKLRKKNILEKRDVDKVYEENYTSLKKMSQKEKLSTAYHEAGHALLTLLSKHYKNEELKIVSIVPTAEYSGVNICEHSSRYSSLTRNAVKDQAKILLGGRVAEEYATKEWNFGASSDLADATSIIRKMIVEMGMDENIYTNISLYDYNSKGHNMSPQAIDKVNERIEEIVKKIYDETKLLLEKNKAKLDIIATLLKEKGIISVQEILDEFKSQGVKI